MSVSASELTAKKCTACEGDTPAFTKEQVSEHLAALPEWKLSDDGKLIRRKYKFKRSDIKFQQEHPWQITVPE